MDHSFERFLDKKGGLSSLMDFAPYSAWSDFKTIAVADVTDLMLQ